MKFIETTRFSKIVYEYLNEDEYTAFQWHLIEYPEGGDIIPESGGLRKIRWKVGDKGKRGGIRVIYYIHNESQIWLITIYKKNEVDNIPGVKLRKIKEELMK